MGKTNYSKMSTQKFKEQDAPVLKNPIDVEPEVDEVCDACAITFEDEVVETVASVKVGKVVKCDRLNIREKPNTSAKVLEIVGSGSLLDVFEDESTIEWLKVTTAKGTEGYCMKAYIEFNIR